MRVSVIFLLAIVVLLVALSVDGRPTKGGRGGTGRGSGRGLTRRSSRVGGFRGRSRGGGRSLGGLNRGFARSSGSRTSTSRPSRRSYGNRNWKPKKRGGLKKINLGNNKRGKSKRRKDNKRGKSRKIENKEKVEEAEPKGFGERMQDLLNNIKEKAKTSEDAGLEEAPLSEGGSPLSDESFIEENESSTEAPPPTRTPPSEKFPSVFDDSFVEEAETSTEVPFTAESPPPTEAPPSEEIPLFTDEPLIEIGESVEDTSGERKVDRLDELIELYDEWLADLTTAPTSISTSKTPEYNKEPPVDGPLPSFWQEVRFPRRPRKTDDVFSNFL